MAKVQQYEAGDYTLLSDRYQQADGTDFEKGDTVSLDAADATRFFNSGAIDFVDSFNAKKARGEITGDSVDLNADVQTLNAQMEALKAAIDDKMRVLEAKGGPAPIVDSNLNTNDRVANAASVSPESVIEAKKAEGQPDQALTASDLEDGELHHERIVGDGREGESNPYASPQAQARAQELGLSPEDIGDGSGSGGRINMGDVNAAYAAKSQ